MLLLTRLNGHPLALNGDLIKSVESSPDTTITLITGEKIVVHESLPQVMESAIAYRAGLLRIALDLTRQNIAAQTQHVATADAAASASIAFNARK